MKKVLFILIVVAMIGSIFSACAAPSGSQESTEASSEVLSSENAGSESAEATEETKMIKIGFSNAGFTDLYSKYLADAMDEYADTMPNVEVKILDSELDAQKQISTIETFISEGVDAIITEPLQGSETGIAAANEAGIPVVAVTIFPVGDDIDYVYVGTREEEVGEIQGAYLAEKLPEGAKVCVLLGNLGATNTNARRAGLQTALFDARPDVVLLDEQSASWETPKAMNITEDWLQRFDHIDAIISQSDQMLLGALEALKNAGRLEETMLIGMDANEPGVNAIRDGEFQLSIFQDPKLQAITALDTALMILNGETPEPIIWTPLTTVTIENVDTFNQ